jgi:uncharacterized membrane protein YbhN (UPF0104 family)
VTSSVRLLVKLLLSGAVVWLVLRHAPLADIGARLAAADARWVALAVLCTAPYMAVAALQLSLLLRVQGTRLAFGEVLRINAAAQFYELFLPGVLAGGAVRAWRLTRAGARPADTLVVMVVNRLLELALTLAIGVACWWLAPPRDADPLLPLALAAALALVAGGWLASVRFAPALARALEAGRIARLPARAREFAVAGLGATAAFARLDGRVRAGVLAASLARHALGVAIVWALARAVGAELSPWAAGYVRSVMMVFLLLPASLGGIGVREGAVALAASAYGVPASQAVALAVLILARDLVGRLAGGAVELGGWLGARPARGPRAVQPSERA